MRHQVPFFVQEKNFNQQFVEKTFVIPVNFLLQAFKDGRIYGLNFEIKAN